jgi:predicted acetyltransferase
VSNGEERLTIRTLVDEDLIGLTKLMAAAFLLDHTAGFHAYEQSVFEPSRSHGVFDDGTLVGTGQMLTRRMTLPGTGPSPIAAITSISVAPDHRRRGILSMIMREQLDTLHAGGEPLAMLWASEGGIYGRFGYGLASDFVRYRVPKGTPFRRGIELSTDRVRELPREQAMPLLRDIYRKVVPTRVGLLERTDGSWEFHLVDSENLRNGMSALRFAVHPEGFAVYRVRAGWEDRGPIAELVVVDLIATNPAAHATLLRYVLDMDLVGEVVLRLPVDEPIIHQLANPRAAMRAMIEGLWVRLVDLDQALPTRTYAIPLDVVLEVSDPVCPWNAGRWRMTVDDGGRARVRRDDAPADLTLGIDDLGAVFLGGTRLTTLAAAGRVREARPGVVARTSLAFLHSSEPACTEQF